MDYLEEILKLLKKLDTEKLQHVYFFLKGMLD